MERANASKRNAIPVGCSWSSSFFSIVTKKIFAYYHDKILFCIMVKIVTQVVYTNNVSLQTSLSFTVVCVAMTGMA